MPANNRVCGHQGCGYTPDRGMRSSPQRDDYWRDKAAPVRWTIPRNPDVSLLSNLHSERPHLGLRQLFLASSDARFGSEAILTVPPVPFTVRSGLPPTADIHDGVLP